MYWASRLCVPETLYVKVVAAFHQEWGHIGVTRMVGELRHRCEFPSGVSVKKVVEQVKNACVVCQKTEPPNWQVAQQIDMTPVPSKVFFLA